MSDFKARYRAAAEAAAAKKAEASQPVAPPERPADMPPLSVVQEGWVDTAIWALSREAEKRGAFTFTAALLHEMVARGVLPDPGEKRVFGAVVTRLRKAGKIVIVGTDNTTVDTRKKGLTTVWEWRS